MDSNNKQILEEDIENKEQFHNEKYKKKSDCPNFLLIIHIMKLYNSYDG